MLKVKKMMTSSVVSDVTSFFVTRKWQKIQNLFTTSERLEEIQLNF